MAGGAAGHEIAALGREYSELRPVVETVTAYKDLIAQIADATSMLADPEMKELAEAELPDLKAALEASEHDVQLALLPKDSADGRPALIEIRPGTGGDEASLFAGDLLRMYQRYSEGQGWKFEILEESLTELGGIKEVTARIAGEGVFARMKYESGVHRVQRVPETESGGRIHTSAATVAVLPEAEDVDVDINPSDLRIDTMRASGSGGQHVNTTDSAVRATHADTGLTVVAREARSQHRNKALALHRLQDLANAHAAATAQDQKARQNQLHRALERGNPVRRFKGASFREVSH